MTARRFVFAPFALAILILLLAFVVRALGLDAESLWYDEGYTVMFAQRGVADIAADAARLELNTPLHYLVLQTWMALAGTSEFALRLPSVLAGLVAVALAFPLARLALGRDGALPALLVALSPVCVMTAREVRMYALASALCAASTVLLLMCLERGDRRLWLAWAAASLAAFATHVLAAFVIGAQAVVVALWAYRAWRTTRASPRMPAVIVGAVCGAVAVAAVALLLGGSSYGTTYRGQLGAIETIGQSFAAQLLPRLLPASLIGPAAAGAAAAFGLAGVGLRRRPLGLALWAITGLSLLGIALFGAATGKFSSRYPAIIAPLFVACLALALAQVGAGAPAARAAAAASAAAWIVASVFGLWQIRTNAAYANEDFRGAVAHIRANIQPDEEVVLVSGHFAPVFQYYWGGTGMGPALALPADDVLNVNNTLTYTSTVAAMNRALAGKGGAWLLLWQDDVIDPTGLAPALLRRQSENLAAQTNTDAYAGLRLQRYRFFHPFQPLPEVFASRSTIEPTGAERGLSGLGCAQPQPARAGDGWIEVHCLWQVEPFVPLSVYTKVSLRLFDGAGNQVLQSDQPIAPNGMPFVPYDKPILGAYFIELPKDLPAGEYLLRAIPYTDAEQLAPQVVTPITVLGVR